MKCFACGYDDTPGTVSLDVLVKDGDMIPNGKKPFIGIYGTITGPLFVESTGKIVGKPKTLYACPNCGTVRMEAE